MHSESSHTDLVVVRQAAWRDLQAAHSLQSQCFGRDAWPWLDVLLALTVPDTIRLKAEAGGALVGLVVGDRRRRKEEGWIATLCVHPAYRRRGIGLRLLQACEVALDSRLVRLSLRASNQAAMTLYDKAGYVQSGTWRGYYPNGEDAIVMERAIR